jgi:aldehyde dehydrogenase (NAD+)
LLINNEFRPAKNNNTLTTPNPATGEDLATVSAATEEDIDDVVRAAREALETTWGKKKKHIFHRELPVFTNGLT